MGTVLVMVIELLVIHNTGNVISNYQVKVYDRVGGFFWCVGFFFLIHEQKKVDLTATVMY